MEFVEFPKVARLSREIVVTEKIDGTNAQVLIANRAEIDTAPWGTPWLTAVGELFIAAGSRSHYVTPDRDNFGFAAWVKANAAELVALGGGRHYGEWWGSGIQRGYGLQKGEKRLSLFNVARWGDDRDREKFPTDRPACCGVVPVLYRGQFSQAEIDASMEMLAREGSLAAPGFTRPEGIVVFHTASSTLYKRTLEGDDAPKSKHRATAAA